MANDVLLGKSVHTPSQRDFRYERERAAAAEHWSSLELLSFWEACRARGGMQMGRDVPCRALVKLLPNLAVTEPIGDWTDGHIRLAGQIYMERFGRDITGMNIRDLYKDDPAGADALLDCSRHCAEHRCPTILRTRVMKGGVALMRFEIAALPLVAPDGETLWTLAGTFRFD